MTPPRDRPVSKATPAQQDAAIAAMISGRTARVVVWVRELRSLMLRAAPGASERGIPGWRIVAYEAPRIFAYLVPLADSVALGFNRGADLADPEGALGHGVAGGRSHNHGVVHVVVQHAHRHAAGGLVAEHPEARP